MKGEGRRGRAFRAPAGFHHSDVYIRSSTGTAGAGRVGLTAGRDHRRRFSALAPATRVRMRRCASDPRLKTGATALAPRYAGACSSAWLSRCRRAWSVPMHGQRVHRLFPREQHRRSLRKIQEPTDQVLVAGKRVQIGADEGDALFENRNLLGSKLVAVLGPAPRDVCPYELGPLFGRDVVEECNAFRPTLRTERIVVDARHDGSLQPPNRGFARAGTLEHVSGDECPHAETPGAKDHAGGRGGE